MIDFTKIENEEDEKWLQALIDRVIKEPCLIANVAKFFDPQLPSLFKDDDVKKRFDTKLQELNDLLGGVPAQFLVMDGKKPTETYDNFLDSTIVELQSLHKRLHSAVLDTHALALTRFVINNSSEVDLGLNQKAIDGLRPFVFDRFWQNAEISYIRAASLWDRVGQLLDYVFFNIRQYERDGFPSVINRIKGNFCDVDPRIKNHDFWKNIMRYANSEKTDGLKWLLRRRNLLIHSVHLGREDPNHDSEYHYYFNNLDKIHLDKLKPMEPEKELETIHAHYRIFGELLEPVVDLSLWGANLISDMRCKKEWVIT